MHKWWVTINIICLKWHKTILGRMKWNETILYLTRKQMNRRWLIEDDLDSGILGDTEGSFTHCVKEVKENSRKWKEIFSLISFSDFFSPFFFFSPPSIPSVFPLSRYKGSYCSYLVRSSLKHAGKEACVHKMFEDPCVSKNDGRWPGHDQCIQKGKILSMHSLEEIVGMVTDLAMDLTRIVWKRTYFLKNK